MIKWMYENLSRRVLPKPTIWRPDADADSSQAEAILSIIQSVEDNEWEWISSDAVAYEIHKTPNEERYSEKQWYSPYVQ